VRYVTVARAAEIAEGQQKLVRVEGKAIVLCRSEGQLFAFENRCTHDQEQLLGGVLKKCTIVCPMHGARFSLKTGAPFGPPAYEPITTYAVRLAGEDIELALPAEN
jgi:3-phenylpropionate/trans-cinnamate dioxygenase ferredoxin component